METQTNGGLHRTKYSIAAKDAAVTAACSVCSGDRCKQALAVAEEFVTNFFNFASHDTPLGTLEAPIIIKDNSGVIPYGGTYQSTDSYSKMLELLTTYVKVSTAFAEQWVKGFILNRQGHSSQILVPVNITQINLRAEADFNCFESKRFELQYYFFITMRCNIIKQVEIAFDGGELALFYKGL